MDAAMLASEIAFEIYKHGVDERALPAHLAEHEPFGVVAILVNGGELGHLGHQSYC
jgi:hypothetical protein